MLSNVDHLRSGNAAASLKPHGLLRLGDACDHLRSGNAAASLKPQRMANAARSDADLRSGNAAASLKPASLKHSTAHAIPSPQRKRCGLIEATA
jgi:hypothetical protein